MGGLEERRMVSRRTYQSPLENSLALRLAKREERGVAETAALKATMVAKREVACMLVVESVVLLKFGLQVEG